MNWNGIDLRSLSGDLIELRRHLHAHPELSFQEENTSAFICRQLDTWGVEYTKGWAGHGIVATINAMIPSHDFIALRADMDALPIEEKNDVPYKSHNPGVMHACGHDVHVTCLLGAIRLIQANVSRLRANVKFIFQPGEEQLPGGAFRMMEEGAFEVEKCREIYALHVFPSMETGKIGMRSGPYMASSDEIYITIKGQGGHGGMPHQTIDPIMIAGHLITGIQAVVSRRSDPTIPCVLTLGKIYSEGGATNVIPSVVRLEGTFRTMDEKWRFEAHNLIHRYCQSLAEAHGASAEVNIIQGYPVLINDEELVTKATEAVSQVVGADHVEHLPIRMTSEDFAWYTQKIRGCFFRLGTSNKERGITSGVHTATFDVDEDSIIIGAQALAAICLK